MLFATDDDDDDFSLAPSSGGSNLASLFSTSQSKVDNNNQSLKYTPPKQPKKQEPASGVPSLIHAAVVTAYKFDGGQYANQGKMGAAILENHEPLMFRIILYKNKQQPLSTTTVTINFNFSVQANNYANFYDNQKINWSILFDSEQSASEFARQIGFTKVKIYGSNLTSLIIQDLNFGDGNEIDNGDSVELKYTGWLMNNFSYGEVFDTNETSDKFLRLKLGKGKAIKGLEEGLLGARKNNKRLIIVPSFLGYDSQETSNKIPAKSTLIFEVFVNKVKFGRESSRSSTPLVNEVDSGNDTKKKDSVANKTHSSSIGNEDSIRARGVSISEQLSQSPKDEKARIISRMAKMGMSLLPKQIGGTGQQSSESETDEEVHSKARSSPLPNQDNFSREQSPKPIPKPRSASNSTVFQQQNQPIQTSASQQMAVLQPPQYLPNSIYSFPYHPSASTLPFNMLQQPFPNHAVATGSPTVMTSIADTHLPLLLSETRTQNTEVRLALGKITEKVDLVIHKLDDAKQQSAISGQIPYLESSILLQNIQRIVQENNKLKQEIDEKNGKIQTLNEKICDLLQRNQRFIEESNSMLEQRSDSLHSTASQSHARLLGLEHERIKLSSELAETISKVSSLQLELSTRQQQEIDLKNQLQTAIFTTKKQQDETETFKLKIKEQEILIATLQQNLKEIRQEKKELEKKLESLEETIEDLKNAKEILEKSLIDKKKQINDERLKAETEIEETRISYEKEIELLRNKFLNKRSVPPPVQITEIEDIESEWKKRSEQLVSETAEKYKEEIEILNKEKNIIENKLKEIENKLEKSRINQSSERDRIFQLEEEIENLKEWKLKYELLYNNSESMKRHYEGQIKEFMKQLNQQTNLQGNNSIFSDELKTAMNKLYRCLQIEFQPESSYSGKEIRQITLNTIRAVTFELLETKHTSAISTDETDKTGKKTDETVQSQMSASESIRSDEPSEKEYILKTENCDISSALHNDENLKLENDTPSQKIGNNIMENNGKNSINETSNQNDITSSLDTAKFEVSNISNNEVKESEISSRNGQDKNKLSNESSPLEKTQVNEKSTKLTEDEKKDVANMAKTHHSASPDNSDSGEETSSKQYLFFDNKSKSWIPQPPPPPLFDDEDEDEDNWLK